MGKLGSRVFFQATLVLALLSFGCLFFVPRGTAEFFIVIICAIVNTLAVLIQLIVMLVKGKKK